jgi:hypothetical protein
MTTRAPSPASSYCLFDPFQIFKESKTPAGLYARKRWLNEESTRAWQADFRSTVESLHQGQGVDGSWDQSFLVTIRALFGLHLTVREPTGSIERALDWLMGTTSKILRNPRGGPERCPAGRLQGLPFTAGRLDLFAVGATLFLATIFGREKEPWVLDQYERLSREGIQRQGRWGGWSSSNTILRAFVVHPEYSRSEATTLAVRALRQIMRPAGGWTSKVPLYQTVNALAHLDLAEADSQINLAFKHLRRTQRRDGSWGGSQREWSTFLVVHALRNKGLIEAERWERRHD